MYDLMAIGELVTRSSPPLALGAVYGELRRHWRQQGRPRKGYQVQRYVRQHGSKPHERLESLLKTALGYSPDQLAKFEKVLWLPPELKEAFAAGGVPLRPLLELATCQHEAAEAAAAEIRSGVPPDEAVAAHVVAGRAPPAPRTSLRRLLRAVAAADAGLAGRVIALSYLGDSDRAALQRGQGLLGELLALPSKDKLLAEMLGVAAGAAAPAGRKS